MCQLISDFGVLALSYDMDHFVASVFGESCTLHITGISVHPLLMWQKPDTVPVHHMLVNALNTVCFSHHVHDLT